MKQRLSRLIFAVSFAAGCAPQSDPPLSSAPNTPEPEAPSRSAQPGEPTPTPYQAPAPHLHPMVAFTGDDALTAVPDRADRKAPGDDFGQLLAADPAGNRVWTEQIEIDHSTHPESITSHLRVVDLVTGTSTAVHPNGLDLSGNAPVAFHIEPATAVIFADLSARGHDLGVVQLGPTQRSIYGWHGKIADRAGVTTGPLDPDASAVQSLAFGNTEDHRAYWVCAEPQFGCDDDATSGVFVQRDGTRARVDDVPTAQQIVWSPTFDAFFAASLRGPAEARHDGCVFRISADGTTTTKLGCSNDDIDDVSITFDPSVTVALVSGSETLAGVDVSRYTWIDLANGHVLDDLWVPKFAAPPYEPLCVWDGGLALVVAGGHSESQPAGVTLIRPGQTSQVLYQDIGSAACDRFPDRSIVVAGGVFTAELGSLAMLHPERLSK